MGIKAEPAACYDPVIRAIHWLTLPLMAAIHAIAWFAHSGRAGEYFQPAMQLHRSLAARGTETTPHALLVAQPLLGLLQTNARAQHVDLFFLAAVSPVTAVDKPLAR